LKITRSICRSVKNLNHESKNLTVVEKLKYTKSIDSCNKLINNQEKKIKSFQINLPKELFKENSDKLNKDSPSKNLNAENHDSTTFFNDNKNIIRDSDIIFDLCQENKYGGDSSRT
jgi:hypothetical protein